MTFSTLSKGTVANDGTGTTARAGADIINALITSANAGALQGFKNRLINGNFAINQRAPATNADDTYCVDRWYVLTQSNPIAVTQLTDPETGAPTGVRLTQSNASAQRMGLAQIVRSPECRDLRSVITTLAGRVRLSTSADVRYAVLEWTGTADSVTSDVVADWTSASYTAGGFFNSTTLNVLACGEVACTAATWRDLTALNATLGASANNIIVMVWTEATVAQNVTLDLNRMQWEPGETATKFELLPFDLALHQCQMFYEKSFALATTPAQNAGASTGEFRFGSRVAGAAFQMADKIMFATRKRSTPTITLYNPAAANAQIRDISASVDFSGSAAAPVDTTGFVVYGTGNASTSATNICGVHWAAESEL